MRNTGGYFCAFLMLGLLSVEQAHAATKVKNFNTEFQPGELIVKFSPHFESATAAKIIAEHGGKIVRQFRASGALHVSFGNKSIQSTMNTAESLAAIDDIEYVEANSMFRLENSPNDPNLGSLWGMTKIKAERAWEISTGDRSVLVGVIDTGVDYNHPDLRANYWFNPGETGLDANGVDKRTNRIDDDSNGYIDDFRGWDFANNDNDPMDDNNHGTHCAGTIGGVGDNGVGVAGVNWQVGIVGLKFISASGSGTNAAAIAAIEYATKIGVNLTSNSWGGGGTSEPMRLAIKEAADAGILFIAAAGNSTANNDTRPNFPSNFDVANVIAVAATDQNDRLASFSSYGLRTVDLAAPGVGIYSTTRNNRYASLSGTSMATPHVAGAVALMMSVHREMSMEQIKAKLFRSIDPVPSLATRVATGGRLNLEKALQP
jgi:subtilisin family serine protease